MARHRLPVPPSGVTGDLGGWLRQLWVVVDSMPVVSYFTGTTPNSAVTGMPGDVAISLGGNVASNSTQSRMWIKAGVPGQASKTDWVQVRTLG